MRGLLLIVLLAIAAGGLFATNPTQVDFESEVEAQLARGIANADPNRQKDEISAVLLAACQAGGTACARLLRGLITIEITDNYLFSTGQVRLGNSEPITCYGLLTRVLCPSA